jgi:hypothetical protein
MSTDPEPDVRLELAIIAIFCVAVAWAYLALQLIVRNLSPATVPPLRGFLFVVV